MDAVSAVAPSAVPVTAAPDAVAIADDVRVRFVSRAEWEAAAFVLVEVDRELSDAQFDVFARAIAKTGLANLEQVLLFDRTTRVRLVPGEVELQRRLAASEARVRDLEAQLADANDRTNRFRRVLATRPAAKTQTATGGA